METSSFRERVIDGLKRNRVIVETKVTREMIGAAHDICLKKGDFVLSADLLERIYLSMDALANHAETSSSLFQMQEAAKADEMDELK